MRVVAGVDGRGVGVWVTVRLGRGVGVADVVAGRVGVAA